VLDSPHLNRIIRIIGTINILSGTVGLAQGIRRIFVQFGLILGPLWAGSMLYQPYYMFSVMLAINLLLMVSILSIFCPLYIVYHWIMQYQELFSSVTVVGDYDARHVSCQMGGFVVTVEGDVGRLVYSLIIQYSTNNL